MKTLAVLMSLAAAVPVLPSFAGTDHKKTRYYNGMQDTTKKKCRNPSDYTCPTING